MWFSVGYVGHMQEKKQDVNKLSVNDVINQISSEWRRYIYSKVDLRKVSINNGLNLRSHDNVICLLDAFQFYRRQSKVVSLPSPPTLFETIVKELRFLLTCSNKSNTRLS